MADVRTIPTLSNAVLVLVARYGMTPEISDLCLAYEKIHGLLFAEQCSTQNSPPSGK